MINEGKVMRSRGLFGKLLWKVGSCKAKTVVAARRKHLQEKRVIRLIGFVG